jgi:alpha-beta hydrolase superfamily lysophospholipase
MSTPTKPSIVFCHGIWADGSCWNKLTGPLQAEGYEVIAAGHPGAGPQPGHPGRPLLRRRRHHRRGHR